MGTYRGMKTRGMKTGHHLFSTEDTKFNFSVGASRSIDHVILLRQWGLQQAPEVQDLSKMLFFDRGPACRRPG